MNNKVSARVRSLLNLAAKTDCQKEATLTCIDYMYFYNYITNCLMMKSTDHVCSYQI